MPNNFGSDNRMISSRPSSATCYISASLSSKLRRSVEALHLLLPALRKQKQAGLCKFEGNLVYIQSSKSVMATCVRSCLKKKKKKSYKFGTNKITTMTYVAHVYSLMYSGKWGRSKIWTESLRLAWVTLWDISLRNKGLGSSNSIY